ncbi:hypothetical protein N9B49_01385 [bacterium]|nr:hypothetical protein [bacterium]
MKLPPIVPWAFALSVGVLTAGAETSSDTLPNFYGFQSEQLFAERRSELLPVVSATKRGVYVQTKSGPKRVSYTAVSGSKRKYFMADNLIEIHDQDLDFQFLDDGNHQTRAMSQMQGLNFSYDVELSKLRHSSHEDAVARMEEIEMERSEYEDLTQEAIEEGPRARPGLHNLLNFTVDLQAERDMEDAFCALVIGYVSAESYDDPNPEKKKMIRAQFIGDIPGGIRHRTLIKFNLGLADFDPEDYQLYIYDGDGEPVPTTQSRMLKELTPQEVLDLMER